MYEAGGVGGDVPTDMPRPLRVGQSVVARHPGTRTAADGIVLTIKPSKYRVQFNRCVTGVSVLTALLAVLTVWLTQNPNQGLPSSMRGH